MGCLATQRYALRVAVLFPTSALVLWFPSTIDADTNAASAISAPWNWRCASLSHRMMAHGSPSVSPCLGPSRRLHRCRGQMSSVAASLATNLIALRHCVAIRGSENDPLCLLWGPVARLLAPQDEATDHGVVVWSPPHPPVTTLILGPAKPPEIRPFWAEFLRFFGPCGAKSWGGWGGSAHYPDPTAQSSCAKSAERREPPARGPRTPGPPGPSGRSWEPKFAKICQKMPNFFFSVVVER